MDGNWIQALIHPVIALALIARGLSPVGDRELQRFVDRFIVRVPTGDDRLVRARLRRSRAIRLSAVAIGVLIAGLPSYMNLIDATRSVEFVNAAVGHAWIAAAACAALLAELVVVQWPEPSRRAAIEERHPHDYAAARWIRSARAAAGLTLIVGAVGAIRSEVELLELSAGITGAMIVLGALWVGLRQIADRPRLAADGPRRDIDDALRCHGAHHLVGAATALATVSLSTALLAVDSPTVLILVGLVTTYVGLGGWWHLARDQVWPVRQHADAR